MVALSEKSLTEKVLAGERISPEEALELYRLPLAELGQLASARRDLAFPCDVLDHRTWVLRHMRREIGEVRTQHGQFLCWS